MREETREKTRVKWRRRRRMKTGSDPHWHHERRSPVGSWKGWDE
jgi:hypothetical protein